MMLPVPTVSDIDVNAERLKDVERDRTRPLPNIAGAAVDALKVGAAVTEMSEQERLRAEARQFQTEYVDKGWEGAQALWQKSGADPSMDPKFWRTAPNATPSAWFEALGKKADETKKKEAVSKYETLVASGTATPAELSAAEIEAGKSVSPEKGLDAIKATADRGFKAAENTKNITSREKIAHDRSEAAKEAARIRRDAAKLNGDDKAQVDYFLENKKNLEDQIEAVYAKYGTDASTRSYSISPEDKKEIDGLSRQRDDAVRQANILIRKGANPNGGDTGGSATVWRKAADGKEYEYDAATKKPTGKSRPAGG